MLNPYFKKAYYGDNLSPQESIEAMEIIMEGKASATALSAFLVSLHMKGETAEEIAAFAKTMREKSLGCAMDEDLLDTCGTGGDRKNLFNISTATALTVAACGVKVAKHGNRAVSSASGSADILANLGLNINLNSEQVALCIKKIGFGFLFAPGFHPAMKHVAPIRKELGVRTVFNILGPLANPFRAQYQVLGVFEPGLLPVMINVLKLLNTKSALVLHSDDGMDEASIFTTTRALYFKDGSDIHEMILDPKKYNLYHDNSEMQSLQVHGPEDSLRVFQASINGANKAASDIVIFNSGIALWISGKVQKIEDGIIMAHENILKGNVATFLDKLVAFSEDFV
jgi:anthranilate phosphoribosyltransferase